MVTKTYINTVVDSAAGATLALSGFDSSAYTHLVALTKHETNNASGATCTDNKGGGTWTKLTQQDCNGNNAWIQLHWVKLGTPGTSTAVTATFNASATHKHMAVWGVNSTTGDIELVDEAFAEGNDAAPTAGDLSNAAADSVVGMYGTVDVTGLSYTPPYGWTEDIDTFPATGQSSGAAGSIGATASTSIPTACTMSGSASWGIVAAIFKELASGPTPPPAPPEALRAQFPYIRPRPFGPGIAR